MTRNFIIGPSWVNDLSVNSVYSDIHKWDIPLKQTTDIITIDMIVTSSFSWHLQMVIIQPYKAVHMCRDFLSVVVVWYWSLTRILQVYFNDTWKFF